jgi:transcriptional regulator with XRE-family HTH domain
MCSAQQELESRTKLHSQTSVIAHQHLTRLIRSSRAHTPSPAALHTYAQKLVCTLVSSLRQASAIQSRIRARQAQTKKRQQKHSRLEGQLRWPNCGQISKTLLSSRTLHRGQLSPTGSALAQELPKHVGVPHCSDATVWVVQHYVFFHAARGRRP